MQIFQIKKKKSQHYHKDAVGHLQVSFMHHNTAMQHFHCSLRLSGGWEGGKGVGGGSVSTHRYRDFRQYFKLSYFKVILCNIMK